jgi:lipoprotein-releasing system permease protein
MLSRFEWMVSLRYLRARREEGLISVIALFSLVGIALGVATLIVVLSVMSGVRAEMIKSIIGLEGHVTAYANGPRGVDDYEGLTAELAKLPGVAYAIPKIEGQIMASHRGAASGALVAGFRAEDLPKKPLLMEKITQGDVQALLRGEGVVIGKRMADRLGIRLGDEITLISPEGRATIAGMVPRVKAYPVVGLFEVGMFAYDNGLVVMPFADAQSYFKLRDVNVDSDDQAANTPGRASSIEVILKDAEQAPALAQDVSRILGEGFRVYDWKSSNNHIFQAVLVQRNVMFLILTLIIVVASFNIISSLIMLVREKGRDVAILRTMGATRGSVMRIFLACGASVGVVGTLLGTLLGVSIALNTEAIQAAIERATGNKLFADELYFLSHLPAKLDVSELLSVVGMSLALSFLATIYPARRAAKLDPAEALRYE